MFMSVFGNNPDLEVENLKLEDFEKFEKDFQGKVIDTLDWIRICCLDELDWEYYESKTPDLKVIKDTEELHKKSEYHWLRLRGLLEGVQ